MMTNVIRQKSVYCIEWTFETTSEINSVQTSEKFSFLNRKCNLKFENRCEGISGERTVRLTFKSDEIWNPALEVLVTLTGNEGLHSETHRMKGRNSIIWTWNRNKEHPSSFLSKLLKFVVTAIAYSLKDDKSTQTPSYFDNRLYLADFSRDFSKLLDEGPNHDVILICEGQTIPAHKNVLCCRSSVFTSMFQSNKLEGTIGEVKIHDMKAPIFKQFLKSLYTGTLPKLTVDIAVQFYKASNEYAIDTIKEQCAQFLVNNLSKENACEILTIADRYGDLYFKKYVIKYILKEKIPLMGEKWTDFCRKNETLAVEVLNLFCQRLSLNQHQQNCTE